MVGTWCRVMNFNEVPPVRSDCANIDYKYESSECFEGSLTFNSQTETIAMVRRNLSGLLLLSLVLSVAFATENKEKTEENEKKDLNENKDEKTVSKRGILHHYSSHGHVHPAVVSYTHHHVPGPIVAKIPTYAKIPVLAKVPVVVHKPIVPVSAVPVAGAPIPAFHKPILPALPVPFAPPALPVPFGPVAPFPVAAPAFPVAPPALPVPFAPAPLPLAPAPLPIAPPQPNYAIVPGGASVTSYSVNYPRALLPQPVLPRPLIPAPAFVPSAVPVAPHFHPYHPHFIAKPAYPAFVGPKPVIPVAVPVPGIRYPKIPVFFNQPRPVLPQLPASPQPTPSFVPVAVPANPQPAVINPGIEHTTVSSIASQDTNMVLTQNFPQIPTPLQPTQPTFMQQPDAVAQTFFPQPGVVQQQPTFMQPTQILTPQPTRPTFADRPLFMPQNPMSIAPTQPTLSQQPSLHIPVRPIMMMTPRPLPTQPTYTNKAPYHYHAPAVPFVSGPSHQNQASSASNVVSGHGQMASQLMQQLAQYQNQRYIQQQQSM